MMQTWDVKLVGSGLRREPRWKLRLLSVTIPSLPHLKLPQFRLYELLSGPPAGTSVADLTEAHCPSRMFRVLSKPKIQGPVEVGLAVGVSFILCIGSPHYRVVIMSYYDIDSILTDAEVPDWSPPNLLSVTNRHLDGHRKSHVPSSSTFLT